MSSSDDESSEQCASTSRGSKRRRSMSSHSCGRWRVDTESLTEDMLGDVGLSLMDDSSGLPTPPDSQAGTTPALKPPADAYLDPYSVMAESYVPEGFLVFKRRNRAGDRLYDPFCRLSDEIMLKIFGLLSKSMLVRCGRVCRRWRQLAFDETLWRPRRPATAAYPGGDIHAYLQRTSESAERHALRLEAGVPGPEHGCRLLPKALRTLMAACQSLQKLSLERCDLTDRGCANIAANTELTALNCALATGITAVGLGHILNGCTRLEELNLGWTELSAAALAKLAACIPTTVTKLNITGCKDELKDSHVRQLLRRAGSRLRELDLSDATSIGQGAFDAMMQYLSAIENIGFSRCYNIPAMNCVQLGQLSTLKRMEVYNCFNEAGVETLRRALPKLQINTQPFSEVARPTVGNRRTSIWEQRVRD
ncbi:S-phase kinase-associated protein 2-like [Pollicipes pollicipes]|uniref:S-phase kinase-associated protein 2-like n=1 Tax=Pollicipes pollicipes TaxID=41117 RepID=UPI001884F566|nr:S-phase kinase-associated protein 2-like [Pollicipes pollicipes]